MVRGCLEMWWPDAQKTAKFPPGEGKLNISLRGPGLCLVREWDFYSGRDGLAHSL